MAAILIEEWARYALTADRDATAPSNIVLAPLVLEVEGQVQTLYPCLVAGGTTPQELYDGNEPALNAYNRMVGYLVAARFLPSRAGQVYQATTITVKIGPVAKKTDGSVSLSAQVGDLVARSVEAALQVPCIAAVFANASANRGNLGFGLAGYRRNCAPSPLSSIDYVLQTLSRCANYSAAGYGGCSQQDDLPSAITILTVQTAASGTGWAAFSSLMCQTLDIVNTTGTDIEYRRGGAGSTILIPDGSARAINAITNANQIEVRRLDQSATQVSVTAEAIAY